MTDKVVSVKYEKVGRPDALIESMIVLSIEASGCNSVGGSVPSWGIAINKLANWSAASFSASPLAPW
jgi:hypothetical protein